MDSIARLDRWLAQNRPDYYAALQRGIDSEALDAFESRFALVLPTTFRRFLEWRNGQAIDCFMAFQFNRSFLPLDRIAKAKAMLDAMVGTEFDDPTWWRTGWIPFLDNGGGDYLCIDTTAEDVGSPGQITVFWHDWEDRSVEYPSFDGWLEIFVEALEAGLWQDQNGDFHPVEEAAWESFLARRNPGYPLARDAEGSV